MDPALAGPVDALEQTWTSLRGVLEDLADEDWVLPTGCPGWTVPDNVSHIIGLERHIRGEPAPDHDLPDLAHLQDDLSRFMERPVDLRRHHAPAEVLAEFAQVTTERIAELRTLDIPGDLVVPLPIGGGLPIKRAMALRVFNCYSHEQDVRRATNRPGNVTGPAATIARQHLVGGWSVRVA